MDQMTITELFEDSTELALPFMPVDLGDDKINEQVNALMREKRRNCRVFLLEWIGDRVPNGAVVDGHEITWTQHGRVISHRKHIGTYDRVKDGPTDKDNLMLVYLPKPKSVFAVRHKGSRGVGQGLTIVVARTQEIAEDNVDTHFRYKKGGYMQSPLDGIDAQPYDIKESPWAHLIDTSRTGVAVEICFSDTETPEQGVVVFP